MSPQSRRRLGARFGALEPILQRWTQLGDVDVIADETLACPVRADTNVLFLQLREKRQERWKGHGLGVVLILLGMSCPDTLKP